MTADLIWTEDGAPRSRRFDDVYFSAEDGLAESRAVFLAGCGLPDAWRERSRFVVGELGFGSGLNVLALLHLWAHERPSGGRLHVFSVEAFPMSPADARRALAVWPELAGLAEPLLEHWPEVRGATRIEWPRLGATLDVVVAEAATALADWDGQADAWFLDGFAPSRNPEMWREELLTLVAARSAPGAVAATFTVAGAVRRGLQAAGFSVDKQPGHGRKRERLEARLTGASPAVQVDVPRWAARPPSGGRGSAAVIGGGIAAAAMVRALRAAGLKAVVVSSASPGASASPAALVEPRLDLGDGPPAAFYAQAFRRAVQLYAAEAGPAVTARGVRKLGSPEDLERFARLAASPLHAPGSLVLEEGPALAVAVGEPSAGPALFIRDGLAVKAAELVDLWLSGASRIHGEVRGLERRDGLWRLHDTQGGLLTTAERVVICAGGDLSGLWPEAPVERVRGQLSYAHGVSGPAVSWGGYAAPAPGGLVFGATHDRNDPELRSRSADDLRNLESLKRVLPQLAATLDRAALQGRAAVRAATPDRLPIAGPVPDAARFSETWAGLAHGREPADGDAAVLPGLYVLGGLGSRGFTTAPLLAEHVAAWLAGTPSPLPCGLAAAVHPSRFLARAIRRSQGGGKALKSDTKDSSERQP